MTWETGVVDVVHGPPSGAFDAWAALVQGIRAAAPRNRLAAARSAVASVLAPSAPGADGATAAGNLAEQMTADVSAVTDEQRAAALAELGSSAFPFLQAVWVCDMGTRARTAFAELFEDRLLEDPAVDDPMADRDPWAAQEQFLRDVAKLTALDPVTAELVRLRGARAHACRLCQSLRSVTAVRAAGGSALFESGHDPESGDLTTRQKVALDLADAFIWRPTAWPDGLADRLRAQFTPLEAVELVLDLMRNSANKIAVALAADAPHVTEGVEYYDIDATSGDLLYGLSPG